MKRLSIVLIATIVVAAVTADQAAWNSWKQKYGRKYKNAAEEQARMKIFADNVKEVERHNELYRNKAVSYRKGLNTFSDMTDREFYSKFMHKPALAPSAYVVPAGDDYISNDVHQKLMQNLSNHTKVMGWPADFANYKFPASVDWRDKGAVTPVKFQCGGSCGLYGPIGATEGQYFLKTGKLVSLSAQNLMDCIDPAKKECYSVFPDDVFSYMLTNGIESAESYAFKDDKGTCNFDAQKSVTKIPTMVRIKTGDEAALIYALATVGPISVGIDATGLKDHESGTFYTPNCTKSMNHVVLAVGYGYNDDGDYYIIKNQWGTGWGEKGFFRMARNRLNNCGIAQNAAFPKL